MNDPIENKAKSLISATAETVQREETLVNRLTDARQAMKMSVEMFRAEWLKWVDESRTSLETLRQWRFAFESEGVQIVKQMKQFEDVRKFFLSDNHVQEMARLKEFVDLCERLKALKDAGFLDQVADTILKLEKA